MKRGIVILWLWLVGGLAVAGAQTNEDANTVTIDVNGLMNAAQQWAQANLDDDVLAALNNVDRDQVADFLKHYQDYLNGDSVLDLGQLELAAATVLPLLEAHEETQPYAAWLRERLDYFEAANDLKAVAGPPPIMGTNLVSGTNFIAGTNGLAAGNVLTNVAGTNVVTVTALMNPPFAAEQVVWTKRVAARPWPKAARELVPELKPIFASEHVPEQLVWLAEVESGFDASAESPVGALGLFQLMPETARRYGLSLWPFDERKQPEPAARAAAKMLRGLYSQFGDWRLAVAAYNCGEGRVQKTLARYGARSYEGIATHLPAETQMYVPKVEATVARREGVGLEELGGH